MKHFQKLFLLADGKIVRLARRQVAEAPEHGAQLFIRIVELAEVLHFDLDGVVGILPERIGELRERHDDLIVRSAVAGKAAMFGENADHCKRALVDENILADGLPV